MGFNEHSKNEAYFYKDTIEIRLNAGFLGGYNLEIAKNGILGDNIVDGGIGPDDIQDNSIGQNKLAAESVGSGRKSLTGNLYFLRVLLSVNSA